MSESEPWRVGWDLTVQERNRFRAMSIASQAAKRQALEDDIEVHPLWHPKFDPGDLMPQREWNGLSALSLFSGGGGLDLGFDRAGFAHAGSWEIVEDAAATLKANRPSWDVHGGTEEGDVRGVDWRSLRGSINVVHGGPPCQPFSASGRQQGPEDPRDMFPEFARAVLAIRPDAFVAENVPALLQRKFQTYLQEIVIGPLSHAYHILPPFVLRVDSFGVPQVRRRVLLIGFKSKRTADRFRPPVATHSSARLWNGLPDAASTTALTCMGVREALGLDDLGTDALAPTIRSPLTGPRHTTSVLSSMSARRVWETLKLWPNGIAPDREAARRYPTPNGDLRISVKDIALIQGFPENWSFVGAVYKALGQIGNAVPPPLAYRVACAVAEALKA